MSLVGMLSLIGIMLVGFVVGFGVVIAYKVFKNRRK